MAKQGELRSGDRVKVAGTKSVSNGNLCAVGEIEAQWTNSPRDRFDVRICLQGLGEVVLAGCDAAGLTKVEG